MNTNKLFPFMGLGALDRSPDDITKDGTFAIMGNGVDFGLPINYGVLLCYNMAGYFASQMCSLSNMLYIRVRDNGVWKPWQRIDNFGYNSLAELSAGVAGQIGLSNQTFVIPLNGIVKVSSNICGLFVFRIGTYSAVVNFSNWIRTDGIVVSGDFSVTKDTDGKCNIYSENSALYLQNLTDTEVTVKSVAIGL